jgi:hypothetical protein
MTNGSHTWRKKRGSLEKQICQRSATKPGRQKIPTFCSVTPGRCLAGTVPSLPTCPRTAALRLVLCPSLLRVSPFTFVLTRAHRHAFHSHFLTAHNIRTVFFNFFLWITFSSVFLTMEPSQEPSFLSQMMMASGSSLPLLIVPHTAPPARPKSKRDWKDDSTALLMDLFEDKFLPIAWTSWHSSSGKKNYWGLRRHFHGPLCTLGLKFSPKYTERRRNLISWNRSVENPAQVNAIGHGLNNV